MSAFVLAVVALVVSLHHDVDVPAPPPRTEVCPGAMWFHRTDITPPDWTSKLEVACVIGDHVFYREPVQK